MGTFQCLLAPACTAQTGRTGWIFKQRWKNVRSKAQGSAALEMQPAPLQASICERAVESRTLVHVANFLLYTPTVWAKSLEHQAMHSRRDYDPLLILLPAHLPLVCCDLVLGSPNYWAVQVWASMMLWVLMPSTSFT